MNKITKFENDIARLKGKVLQLTDSRRQLNDVIRVLLMDRHKQEKEIYRLLKLLNERKCK